MVSVSGKNDDAYIRVLVEGREGFGELREEIQGKSISSRRTIEIELENGRFRISLNNFYGCVIFHSWSTEMENERNAKNEKTGGSSAYSGELISVRICLIK